MKFRLPPMKFATQLVRAGSLFKATEVLRRTFLNGVIRPPSPAGSPQPFTDAQTGFERGSFTQQRYTNAAGTRTYKVYTPAGLAGQSLPVVVMLHGCRQDPDDFAAGTRMNRLADALGFVAVYPAQSRAANVTQCWNWFNAAHQSRDAGEPSLIAGITRAVVSHGNDARRVYIAGLSAGGAMAAIMAATYPELYKAVGVHSGLPHGAAHDLPSAFAAMKGKGTRRHNDHPREAIHGPFLPLISFHGDEDTTVHASNGAVPESADTRVQVENDVRNGLAFTRTAHIDVEGKSVVEHWMVHGGGHAWSGGSASGTFADPRGPDASREMLRFFLQHR